MRTMRKDQGLPVSPRSLSRWNVCLVSLHWLAFCSSVLCGRELFMPSSLSTIGSGLGVSGSSFCHDSTCLYLVLYAERSFFNHKA